MLLCLDVGNSQIYCGIFVEERLSLQFRRTSTVRSSSDELGVFLRGALRGEGRRFARSLETDRAGRSPADRVPVGVGDGNDRVVERGLHMSNGLGNVALGLLLLTYRHDYLPFTPFLPA